MPRTVGCSVKAYTNNIRTEINAGKERDQAVAIAINYLKKDCGVTSKKRMTPAQIISAGSSKKNGESARGVRDGSGPSKDSYRRKKEKKKIGRRKERGEKCPNE